MEEETDDNQRNISTHSLTKRLTFDDFLKTVDMNISTHSLTKRLTFIMLSSQTNQEYFNSQPHEEADCFWIRWVYITSHFNSQPHEEADFIAALMFRVV